MRKYISSLRDRSDRHKKGFSYAVAGIFTLSILSIWSLVNFGMGQDTSTVKTADSNSLVEKPAVAEPSPLEGLGHGVANSLEAVKQSVGQILNTNLEDAKNSIESIDVDQKYQDLRDQALK